VSAQLREYRTEIEMGIRQRLDRLDAEFDSQGVLQVGQCGPILLYAAVVAREIVVGDGLVVVGGEC